MATDDGIRAKLEAWFVSQLTALTHDGAAVFKTVDHWRHQIGVGGSGTESFDRFAPFAFVEYIPAGSTQREGGYDLNNIRRIGVAIGQKSNDAGDARIGNTNKLGTSEIADLVEALFEGAHPGEGFDCDNFYYVGEKLSIDTDKHHAIELFFEANDM